MSLSGKGISERLDEHLNKKNGCFDSLIEARAAANASLDSKSATYRAPQNSCSGEMDEGPDPANPRVVRCKRCNGREYIGKPVCRCGAYLRGQVDDDYSKWVLEKDKYLANRAEKYRLFQRIGSSAGCLPFILTMLLGNIEPTSHFVLSHIETLSHISAILLILGAPLYGFSRSEAEACQNLRSYLSFDYYLQTEFPCETPKSYRKRRNLKRLLKSYRPTREDCMI